MAKNAVKQERPEWGTVYEETKRRFREDVFDPEAYDSMCIAFSGGKDSNTVLQMALDAWYETDDWDKPIHLVHIDDEVVLPETEEFLFRLLDEYDQGEIYLWWCCLPTKYRNACTNVEQDGWWYPWHPEKEDEWVREMPDLSDYDNAELVTLDHPRMADNAAGLEWKLGEHEHKHVATFLMHEEEGYGTTIQCTGVRTAESLTRYKAIVTRGDWIMPPEDAYMDRGNLCVSHPCYDWDDRDLWHAHHRLDWDYNRAYDKQAQIGLAPRDMRTAHPYGEEAVKCRNYEELRYAWPEVYEAAKGRVPGSDLGFEMGSQVISADKREDQTWAERCAELIAQIDDEDLRETQRSRVQRVLDRHSEHSTQPLPEKSPCKFCSRSWKDIASSLQKGDLKGRGGL